MKFLDILLVLGFGVPFLLGSPLPVVNLNTNESTNNLAFNLVLPDNNTAQVTLSFRLMTVSTVSTETNTSFQNDADVAISSSSWLTSTSTTTTTTEPSRRYVTVDEAIEGFRQALIKKEMEIAGIIESENIFYRHFKLEFDDDKILTVRCTYDSNYSMRSLKIACYEYHEFETERILSNGEVEYIKQADPDYRSNIEFLDLKKMKQTYSMSIA